MTKFYVGRETLREKAKYLIAQGNDTTLFYVFMRKVLLAHLSLFVIFYFIYQSWHAGRSGILIFGFPFWLAMIGYIQYYLAQSSHEAIHYYINHKNSLRTVIVSILTLYCIGVTQKYKRNHARHHVHFGEEKLDPDYPTFMGVPKSKLAFWQFLAGSLLGISALKRILQLALFEGKSSSLNNKSQQSNVTELVKLCLMQLSILAIFFQLDMVWVYFSLWLLPLLVVTKTLIDIRLLAEHGPIEQQGGVLRSFMRKGLSTRLLGVFGFQYHAHHHIMSGVVTEKLPELVALIQKNLMSAKQSENDFEIYLLDQTYFQFLKQYYYSLPLYQRWSEYVSEL